jgi:hypothetical protein
MPPKKSRNGVRVRESKKHVPELEINPVDTDMEGTPQVVSFENANTPCTIAQLQASSRCFVSIKNSLTPDVSDIDSIPQMISIVGSSWLHTLYCSSA